MREIRLWVGPHWSLGLFQRRRGVCVGLSIHWGAARRTLQVDLLLLIIQVSRRS